jgi:hypothetical protein
MNYQIVSVPATATGVTLAASPSNQQIAGNQAFFTATGSGGTGTYEYEFYLFNGAWTLVQPFSASNTWTWNTTGVTPGTYTVDVYVRSAGSTSPREAEAAITYQIVAVPAAATGVTLAASPPNQQAVDNTAFFTATGSGGTGTYEYQFFLFDGTTWTTVQPYTASNTWAWNTTGVTPGTYTVDVYVRSAGSSAAKDSEVAISYQIVATP